MKKQIVICDICKREVIDEKNWVSLTFLIDRKMDVSGHGMENIYKTVEICQPCAADVLLESMDCKFSRFLLGKLIESDRDPCEGIVAHKIYEIIISKMKAEKENV